MLLGRYLAAALWRGTLQVLLVLAALLLFVTLIGELEDIGVDGYEFTDALIYSTLQLPRSLLVVMAPVALLGTLAGLGALAGQRELLAMRAGGMSRRALVTIVLAAAASIALPTFLVADLAVPATQRIAQNLQAETAGGGATRLGDRIWLRDQARFISVARVESAQRLVGIQIYELDGDRLTRVIAARAARIESGRWWLQDYRLTTLTETGARAAHGAELAVPIAVGADLVALFETQPEMLSVRRLHRYIDYLQRNELQAGDYQMVFWQRLSLPASILVMSLLAVPFLYGSPRAGLPRRLAVGVLFGVVFFLLQGTLASSAQIYGIHPALAAFAPPVLAATVTLFAFGRVR